MANKILTWIRKKNEFTFIIALIALIWVVVPDILRMVDPQSGEFSVDILYIPLIAGIYFFVGLLFVWAYLALVFNKGYKLLDTLFENEKLTQWQKIQTLLKLFFALLFLYAMSLLAVTGISAIMTA